MDLKHLTDLEIVSFAHRAMATQFEIFIANQQVQYAEQAAHEAFARLDLLEQDLSRFIENSDISRINHLKKNESVIINHDSFECLKKCQELYHNTNKSFDPGFGGISASGKKNRVSDFSALILDEKSFSVRLSSGQVDIDLGGYGKGFGVDKMVEVLIDWEIDQFLIHGGYSSVRAADPPAGEPGWPISISHPQQRELLIKLVHLKQFSLSSSGLKKGMHIFNPHHINFTPLHFATWVKADSAAVADGLSTAFMVMETDDIREYTRHNSNISAVVVDTDENVHFLGSDF